MIDDKAVTKHTKYFQTVTKRALEDMFNCEAKVCPVEVRTTDKNFVSQLPFSVRIHFTGLARGKLVSGEYILATDERVAASACSIASESASSAEVETIRHEFSDAFSELLTM